MKTPAKAAGANIEGANVAGRGWIGLRIAAANDNQILVNNSGAGESDGLGKIVSPKALPQIDSSLFAKGGNRFASFRIERIEIIHHSSQNPAMAAVTPVGNASRRLTAVNAGIEFPKQLSGCCVERNYLLRSGIGEESPTHDDRACFQPTLFGRIEPPRFFELLHIAAIDLQ